MPKRYNRKIMPLTEEDLKILMKARMKGFNQLSIRGFHRLRDAFSWYFGFHLQGLRPGEIRCARISDINWETSKFYVSGQNNKLKQDDWVHIPQNVLNELKLYLQLHNRFYNTDILFPTNSDGVVKELDRATFDRIFRNTLREAGMYRINFIDRQGLSRSSLNTYSIRVGFANWILPKINYDFKKLQVLMRHRDVSTTIRFYYRLNDNQLKEKIIEGIWN